MRLDALNALRAEDGDSRRSIDRLSDETAEAVIRAYQRGVQVKKIIAALGIPQGSFSAKVGAWALQRCKCRKRK